MNGFQIGRTAEAKERVLGIDLVPQQNDNVTFVLEPLGGDAFGQGDDPHHGDGGGGIDGPLGALVVETHVAARDRRVEDAAGLRQSANRFLELPEDLRVVRIAEVQIVGRAQRRGPGAGEIARRLGHRDFAAFIRIQINVGGIAIHRQRDELVRDGCVFR